MQSLLLARSADLPFGLSGRDALWAISLGAGLVINFVALATIYRTVPNTPVAWHGVWPGALGATVAIFVHRLRLPVLPHERLDASPACARRSCSS